MIGEVDHALALVTALERVRDGGEGAVAIFMVDDDRNAYAQACWNGPAELCVELSFDADGAFYEGLPLDQASGAMQLRVSIAIASATIMRPRLSVSSRTNRGITSAFKPRTSNANTRAGFRVPVATERPRNFSV